MRANDVFKPQRDLERLKEASWWPIETSDSSVEENPLLESRLLGHICRSARGLLGMSQIELADAAGISRKTVLGVEGSYGQPDAKTVSALKAVLLEKGISVDLNAKQLCVSIPLELIDPLVARTLKFDAETAQQENKKRITRLLQMVMRQRKLSLSNS